MGELIVFSTIIYLAFICTYISIFLSIVLFCVFIGKFSIDFIHLGHVCTIIKGIYDIFLINIHFS